MAKEQAQMQMIENPKYRKVTFFKRRKGLFKKAEELSILCSADVAIIIFPSTGKLYQYSSSSMNEILERHSSYVKNLEKMAEPWSSGKQPVRSEDCMLNNQVAEKSGPLRKMMGDLQGMNSEELELLEKCLEAGLSRLVKKKAEKIKTEIESLQEKEMQLMEENNRLRHQKMMMEISRGGQLIPADLGTMIHEAGPSYGSVTNSSRLPQDYENSDTSLKLGLNY